MAKVCAKPGCPALTEARRSHCSAHEVQRRRAYDENRPSARARGYDSKWEKARKGFLRSHRWCVMCEAEGYKTEATEVDHKTPHKGDKRLFWDRTNWQPLCKPHHSAKTMSELHGREYRLKGCDRDGNPLDRNSHWYR